MITTAMPAAIKPYSMAVAPESSRRNRRNRLCIAYSLGSSMLASVGGHQPVPTSVEFGRQLLRSAKAGGRNSRQYAVDAPETQGIPPPATSRQGYVYQGKYCLQPR